MNLKSFEDAHIPELMGWFPDAQSCRIWAGPEFRFPFTEATFKEDLRPELPTFVLVGHNGEIVGFGQYYMRANRCHLARLAVSPRRRGHGIGAVLIRKLTRLGCSKLNTPECSLFVFADNPRAVGLYARLGFVQAPYPGEPPKLDGAVYMVAAAKKLLT